MRDIQLWTKESGIGRLLAAFPKLYPCFYEEPLEEGPGEEEERRLRQQWKKKLEPVLWLPKLWAAYMRDSEKLLLRQEKSREFRQAYEKLYWNHVDMYAVNESGNRSGVLLEERLERWLYEEKDDKKVLLGEFGDGKTFFTYCFARKLQESFRLSPDRGYIPIRFALQDYREGMGPEAFLQNRLLELGGSLTDLLELREQYRVLVILDGFDEMSRSVDAGTVRENAARLLELCRYLGEGKILITSRKQCFLENGRKEFLRDRLGGFEVLELAALDQEKAFRFAQERAVTEEQKAKFLQWRRSVGENTVLAKPLFLEMTVALMEAGHSMELDEVSVYEAYIDECLKRKFEISLEHRKTMLKRAEIIERAKEILEELAWRLQEEGKDRISPRLLPQLREGSMADWLWELPEEDGEDAKGRISMRSLLKYEDTDEISFFHRSVKEYFVAVRLVRLLDEGEDALLEALENGSYNYEIFRFAGVMIQRQKAQEKERVRRIAGLLGGSRIREGRNGAAAAAMNLMYRVRNRLPEGNYRGLDLSGIYVPGADFSGRDFEGSSFLGANLNNVRPGMEAV